MKGEKGGGGDAMELSAQVLALCPQTGSSTLGSGDCRSRVLLTQSGHPSHRMPGHIWREKGQPVPPSSLYTNAGAEMEAFSQYWTGSQRELSRAPVSVMGTVPLRETDENPDETWMRRTNTPRIYKTFSSALVGLFFKSLIGSTADKFTPTLRS